MTRMSISISAIPRENIAIKAAVMMKILQLKAYQYLSAELIWISTHS